MKKTNLNIVPKELMIKLLEKGFNYEVDYVYDDEDKLEYLGKYTDKYENKIPAPHADIVIQFLRENYDIDVFGAVMGNITMPKIGYAYIVFFGDDATPKFVTTPFESYEDAILDALDKVLKFMDGEDEFDKNEENNEEIEG